MSQLLHDLRWAARSLRRSPSFTLATVLCLAVGVGSATALFSAVHGVLLTALPFERPGELVTVWGQVQGEEDRRLRFSAAEWLDLERQASSFTAVAALASVETSLTGEGTPERLVAGQISANLFPLLGVSAHRGRVLTADEDTPEAPPVVLLSHDLWQRRFAGRGDLVGSEIVLDDRARTVVGILPADLELPLGGVEHDLWLPLSVDRGDPGPRALRGLVLVGRLGPTATAATARAELETLAATWQADHPRSYPPDRTWGFAVVPLFEELVGDAATALWAAFGMTALVLLIACANVTSLWLARSLARRREASVQVALGAGRAHLLQRFLAEGLLLALAGGLGGLALAWVAVTVLPALDPGGLPRLDRVTLGLPVVTFALATAGVSLLLVAAIPALGAARPDVARVLREGGKGTVSRHATWLRNGLVVAEVALGTVALVGSLLLLQSYLGARSVNPGVETSGRLTFQLFLPPRAYPERPQMGAFVRDLIERLEALPGIRAVGAATTLPIQRDLYLMQTTFDTTALPPEEASDLMDWRLATPDYFQAAGIPVLRGRAFRPGDDLAGDPVALVDATVAERFWPGQDPLGQRLILSGRRRWTPEWRTVVGVVGHVRASGLTEDARGQVYTPFAQSPLPFVSGIVWTDREPASLAGSVREAIWSLDRDLPVSRLRSLEDVVAETVAPQRFYAALWTIFALVTGILVALGLYGVTAYSVTRRTRELGIRLALGERRSRVLLGVVRRAALLAAVGVVGGLALSLASGHLLDSLLYGVANREPGILSTVAALLVLLAALSALGPALRAIRVDPMVTLKEE